MHLPDKLYKKYSNSALFFFLLFTLRYFNILPLPYASFFPHESITTLPNTTDKTMDNNFTLTHTTIKRDQTTIEEFLNEKKSKTITNNSSDYINYTISNSLMKFTGKVTIDVELQATFSQKSPAKSSISIHFTNAIVDIDNSYIRKLSILYYKPTHEWLLKYTANGKDFYFNAFLTTSENTKVNVSLTISPDGKTITIFPQTDNEHIFNLSDSLYTLTNTIKTSVELAPHSQMKIDSLLLTYGK